MANIRELFRVTKPTRWGEQPREISPKQLATDAIVLLLQFNCIKTPVGIKNVLSPTHEIPSISDPKDKVKRWYMAANSMGRRNIMEMSMTSTPPESPTNHEVLEPCTLHVCTSCRPRGTPREPRATRPGFILYQQLRDIFEISPLKHRVTVSPAECLSICPRPCGVALSLPESWTYLFGDQQPTEALKDIVDCVTLYLESPDGFMARASRPKSLRNSILGRVPPKKKDRSCT